MRKAFALFLVAAIALLLSIATPPAIAQSQAQNGQIEGTALDQNNAVVRDVAISATSTATGVTRSVATDASGVYRFPLLPLGTYRVTAVAATFKTIVRDGIVLAAGQTATVDLVLEPGEVREVVTSSGDSSIADAGKTDLGRVMDAREAQNLPLIQRSPYNLGLLQTNVTGRPQRGFGLPSFNVNGYLRRVNYLIDGNGNTAYDRRSRFLLLSETSVSEIQLVTNGFAPEFGDTPGMIMNIITPSGTNALHGAFSYRFRRAPFYSRPFFFPAAVLPGSKADIFTATIGGPIVRDRWHFYFGFEQQYREDKADAARLSTITASNRERLIAAGLPAAIFPPAIPGVDRGSSYIFRTDFQINDANRLSVRFNHSNASSDNSIGGRLNTLERSVDSTRIDYGLGVQLASYTARSFNELRFAHSKSSLGVHRNEFSGTGPSISIQSVANFGSPPGADTVTPPLRILQLQDNVTRTFSTHVIKFGGGFSRHDYIERAAVSSVYRFASITKYINARNGSDPLGYINYRETFGNPETHYKATYWNVFVQDDWKLTRRLKLNYGLRYDFYQIPDADPTSPFLLSKKFDVDKNDIAPRVGLVYALGNRRRQTVVRIGAGIYYEAPLLSIFRDVIRFNGNPQFFSVTFEPTDVGAPRFPEVVGLTPTAPRQNIYTIASDYDTMYALHSNVQIEQALTADLSLAVGYVHSAGRHLNVYWNINPNDPVRYLADGRPVYGKARIDPRFGWIVIAESAGVASYDALSFQLKQRLSRGLQFSVNYTLSKAINDSPDGDIEGTFLSDPSYRGRDRGYSSADQRHTFTASFVFQPKFTLHGKFFSRLLNDNQFGVIATTNSGQRFNIYADVFDLNGDDIDDDRPVGIDRNAGKTPPQFNVDLRYSRFITFTERYRLELFAEFQNLFNTNVIVGYSNTTVETDPITGLMTGPLPDFKARNSSTAQESRQIQLGLKFIF